MDLVRSCYRTTMRFFQDDPLEIPVTWYFCAPGAQVFPDYHRFASGNWASDKSNWTGPGEAAWRPRAWSDGHPPGPEVIVPIGGFIDAFPPSNNAAVSDSTVQLHDGQTILVFLWCYRNAGGHSPIASVTDLAGNVYVQDFTRLGAVDTNVRLEVWRARHAGPAIFTTIRANYPGTQLFVTFTVLTFSGLLNQAPVATTSNRGIAGVNPQVPRPIDTRQSRLIVATFSCGAMAALTTVPGNFVDAGAEVTNGTKEDGDLALQILHFTTNDGDLRWTGTINYEWVAAALVYEGVPKLLLPGTHFCGALETYRDGGLVDGQNVPTDKFGVSVCCGPEWPFFLACQHVDGPLILTILQIYDHGATSVTHVGQTLRLIGGVSGGWSVDPEQYHEVCPGFLGFGFGCSADLWIIVTPGVFGVSFGAASQRQSPPGILFWGIFPIVFPNPGNDQERWDCLIAVTPK